MNDVFRKQYRPLGDIAKLKIEKIKDAAEKLYNEMDMEVGCEPRMMAIAKTNLEQAIMWAIKSIT